MIDPKPAMLLFAALALGGCDLTSRGGAGESAAVGSPLRFRPAFDVEPP